MNAGGLPTAAERQRPYADAHRLTDHEGNGVETPLPVHAKQVAAQNTQAKAHVEKGARWVSRREHDGCHEGSTMGVTT